MADDIILTEEEQVERIKQWWKKSWLPIVVGVVVGLSLVFAYKYWQDSKKSLAGEASAMYFEIISATEGEPDPAKVSELSQRFKSDFAKTPYASKAILINAKSLAEANKYDEAAQELRWVIDNSSENVTKNLARLRLATIQIEQNKLPQASETLDIADTSGFKSNFAELKGDIARLQENYTEAKQFYQSALDDAENGPYSEILKLRINQVASLAAGPSKQIEAAPATVTTEVEATDTAVAEGGSANNEIPGSSDSQANDSSSENPTDK